MEKVIIGKKLGMTQMFTETGELIPVTAILAGPCPVVQVKTLEGDGYQAVQVAYEPVPERKLNRPERGHFAKANIKPHRILKEFRLNNAAEYKVGDELTVASFQPGDAVDVTGISKGKGFAGGIKRWGFSRGPESHGSKYHRGVGSLQARDAARVFKGRKMPGHMGAVRRTVQNLQVVKVDPERNLLLVKGSIPGAKGSVVTIKNSVKA
ncbi:MAG: 50S ribosomal protein L3 [Firmicutes bacterium]|jgi:large subunit ribosomal protein L3|nr:50S ribosomal protein L3 [Bacillota bacterium]